MMDKHFFHKTKITKELLAASVILLTVFFTYSNALSNKFAYDDVLIVENNPIIRDWHSIPDIFHTGYWSPTGMNSGGLYRPLTTLSFLAEYQLNRLNPRPYHLDNIILHFLCCVLVYLIVSRLTASTQAGLLSSLIFATHPVHVEVVSNVVGRAELLATLFILTGFYTFVWPVKRLPWYIVSPAMMFLGLISKETAIVLPALIFSYLLIYERDGRGRDIKRIAAAMLPYVIVTAAFLLIRYIVLADDIVPKQGEQVLGYTKGYWRFLVMTRAFFYYIRLTLFPTDLRIHYMLRPPDSFLNPWTILFVVLCLAFTALVIRYARTRRDYVFFGTWFVIALLPVSNIIPIGLLMAERVMYLSSVAACAIAGLIFTSSAGWPLVPDRKKATAAIALSLIVVVSLGTLSYKRNPVWKDKASIAASLVDSYKHVIADFPESAQYYVNLSEAYIMLNNKKAAFAALEKGIEVEPGYMRAHLSIARIYLNDKKYNAALSEVETALSLPTAKSADDYLLCANVFNKNGMKDKARFYINKALSDYTPNDHKLISDMAVLLMDLGQYDKAEPLAKKAVELDPYVAPYHIAYASLLIKNGDYDAASRELDAAEALDPSLSEIYFQRGLLLGSLGRYMESAVQLEMAAKMDPKDPAIHYYLGAAYHGAGLNDESVRELELAIKLRPDYEEARQALENQR